ncbi:MAG TPA: tetratricopeptide repeat-containing sensor histidine kinase [Bacteroidales bacterium]|nr:tetratricopeptide repeat-containing sensor histidine kinase [Bacteroidales bacterium]
MRIFNFLFSQISIFIILLILIPKSLNSFTINNRRDTFQNAQNIELINKNIEILRKKIENKHDSIKKAITQNLNLSLSEDYNYGLAWNYYFLGRHHQLKQEHDSAIFYYQKAWPIAKANKKLNLANPVSTGLTNIYWETGNYSSGLEMALDAEQFFEQHEAINDKFAILNLIALNYEGLFEFEKALEYFNKALKAAKNSKRENFQGVIYSNIGRLYYKKEKYNQALEYMRKGVKLEERYLYFSNAGKTYTMMANAFLELNHYDSTLVYLKKAYNHNINTEDDIGLARTYLGYGKYYQQINQYSTSVDYLFKVIEIAQSINLNNETLNAYQLLAQNYEQAGNYSKSTEYYKKYFTLYQQIYNVEKINQLNALEHKLKMQIKENEINRLKIKEEKQTIKYLNIINIAGILLSLFLLIFIFYSLRNNKILKHKNKEINQQKAHLEALNEKLILAETNAGKADEIKTRFLNNLSHEIRTPLNGIVGFSSLIAESKLSEDKKPQIWNIIRKNSEELINTIDGLLELSIGASGGISIKKSAFNVYDFLYQEHFKILEQYKDTNPSINFKFLPDSRLKNQMIISDKDLFKKCILKVVDNAFKFTQKGSIELGLKEDNNFLQIIISDTGIGISEEKNEEIFTQFVKGKNIPNNSAGLGIGLTIAKHFIELLGGKISYETEIDKGSTFFISIPSNNK